MPRFRPAVAMAALTIASSAAAQGLPAYVPINPVTTSRSALYLQPFELPAPTWRLTAQVDWASLIELTPNAGADDDYFLLDAELLRLDLTLIKDYRPGQFLLLSASLNSAGGGVMDGFYDWYHELTGLRVPAREARPRNEFAYEGRFPGGEHRWSAAPIFLGDLKVGLGVRNTPSVQTLLYATLPTTSHRRGYGRGVISVNGLLTARRALSNRLGYEGGLGLGWTPRHGDLEAYQKTVFWSAHSGLRFRFWGQQSMFFSGFYQSAGYRDTGLRTLDGAELTADMGFLVRVGRSAPELILALTEDLKPSGPAIDAAFRIGLRW